MNILAWLVVGLIAGWLAGQNVKGGGYGIVGDMVVAVVGALLAGFLAGQVLGGDYLSSISVTIISVIVAFVGAIILIGGLRMMPGRSRV